MILQQKASKKSSLHASIIPKFCIRIGYCIEITMPLTAFWYSHMVWFYNRLKFALNWPRLHYSSIIFFSTLFWSLYSFLILIKFVVQFYYINTSHLFLPFFQNSKYFSEKLVFYDIFKLRIFFVWLFAPSFISVSPLRSHWNLLHMHIGLIPPAAYQFFSKI